jgi:hypothetical protein
VNAAERDLRDYLEDILANARKLTATREIDVVIEHLPAIIAELG